MNKDLISSKLAASLGELGGLNREFKSEKDKKDRELEAIKGSLGKALKERDDLDAEEAISLKKQVNAASDLANKLDDFAEKLEKGSVTEEESKKRMAEYKVWMEELGISPEMIGMLQKGGPEALRKAAKYLRGIAAEKQEQIDVILNKIKWLDDTIKNLKGALNENSKGYQLDDAARVAAINRDIEALDAMLKEFVEQVS